MIELSRHIKALLLENDCVIIPGLGGFIAHNRPAIYEKASNTFFPPMRTIGFNPQLTINDGVLVQSYMEAYDTDFPDATRKIEKAVEYIKSTLYADGRIELNDIGMIYYNVNGSYEFEPFENAFFSPTLYGLDDFKFPKLEKTMEQKPATTYDMRPVAALNEHQHRPYRHVASLVFRNAVAVAAAILLFFVLSVPVENTYVDDANYASIGSIGMFHSIKDFSAATMDLSKERRSQATAVAVVTTQPKAKEEAGSATDSKPKRQIKPVAVKTVTVAARSVPVETASKAEETNSKPAATPATVKTPTPKEEVAKTPGVKANIGNSKGYYIIIASLPTRQSAEKELSKFKATGCKDALILETGGRFRIAYNRYDDKTLAYKDINTLKQNESFKSAWVFTAK